MTGRRISVPDRVNIGRLFILSGLNIPEISERMDISEYTVRRHLMMQRVPSDQMRKRGYKGSLMADGSFSRGEDR